MRLPVHQSKSTRAWYADGLNFQCTQCGNCCTGGPGYVWISDVEITRLATHLKMTEQELAKKYLRKISGKFSLKERKSLKGEYDCVFLEEMNGRRACTVYEVRPLQCRTWPFWDGNLISQNSWNRAGKTCPGLNKGRKFTQKQIEALRDAEDWPDRPPSSK
ncbi:MAG TPA: YkgJ family cysteine cluster protein [Tepidisphaeraceae bacterium]|nr:YkgJ family cysteine cluster protein [Tepidisphaeraceae bacterium]